MAEDDLYKVDVQLEAPSGNASFGVYYHETVDRDGASNDTETLADAFDADVSTAIINVLPTDWKYPSFIVSKVYNDPVEKFLFNNAIQVGDVSGPSLPANNAAVMTLHQSTFSPKSDGRIFIPGVAEVVTNVGVLTAGHLNGVLLALADALIGGLTQVSAGAGRWELGVISAKVRDVALPAKDWDAAFAPVTSITRNPIIGTQRRRQTKVRGRSI